MRRPGWSVESFSCRLWWCCLGRDLWSTEVRHGEGRNLWSTVALGRWWWWEEESRTSVALPKTRVDPGWSIESTPCLDLKLDLPDEDEGRVRSSLSWRLGKWRALGDSWRLEDPWWRSLWPRSSLYEWWRSDPLVPYGPLDREDRSTTDTLDESLTGLLIMGSGRTVIHGLRRLGRGGCLVFSRRVLMLPGQPVISLIDGWILQTVLRCVSNLGTCAAVPAKTTGHVIPPSCFVDRQRMTVHTSRNKRRFLPKITWKNAHSCNWLANEVSSHQLTLFLA